MHKEQGDGYSMHYQSRFIFLLLSRDDESQTIPAIYDTPSSVLDDSDVLDTAKNTAYGVTESASDHYDKPSL